MIDILIKTLWLLLPALFANSTPILFKWVPFLNYPIDFNKKFRGKPLFGKNKTYRGFIFGVLMAILIVYIQYLLYPFTKNISLINYTKINIFLLGFLIGFGTLLGDLIESFFKRRLNIKPGELWFPFDQIDWVVGALFFMSFYVKVSWMYIFISIILAIILHPFANLSGYYLGIKKNKY